LPRIGGVEGLHNLAAESPDSGLVVLARRFDRGSGVRALRAGAAGYISQGIAPEALPRIIRGVMGPQLRYPSFGRVSSTTLPSGSAKCKVR